MPCALKASCHKRPVTPLEVPWRLVVPWSSMATWSLVAPRKLVASERPVAPWKPNGGYHMQDLSISQVIDHVTCYKFKCSHRKFIFQKKFLYKICSPVWMLQFQPMRALEFIRDHVTFKLPYDFSYQMKTPLNRKLKRHHNILYNFYWHLWYWNGCTYTIQCHLYNKKEA